MGRLKPVAASLTPPATYDYSYTWNAGASEQYLNVNGVDSIPLYTRIADGIYFNYTSTFNVIDGLIATHTFNRSNTTWQVSGSSYKPDDTKIGSDSTVGSISNKVYLKFDNQTNKDYTLWLDTSNTSIEHWTFEYNDIPNYGRFGGVQIAVVELNRFYVPAFTKTELYRSTTSTNTYFDAWYLEDLGISDAYQQGLDAETDGILTDYLGTDAQQIGWVLIGIAAILFAFKGGK
jgi:hypothetical protein